MAYDPMRDDPAIPNSYWAATAPPEPETHSLDTDLDVDLAVIGGGFSGLSTGLHAALAGQSVAVLEANRPGWGASGRNNGQVVAALKHEPHQIRAAFGAERGDKLIKAIGKGPDLVFSLTDRYGIDCNPLRTGIITAANDQKGTDNLRHRVRIWNEAGAPLAMLSRDETRAMTGSPYYVSGCIDPRGGSVNPLAYARGLCAAALREGAQVYSQTPVKALDRKGERWVLTTPNGNVTAARVVIATNAYTGTLAGKVRRSFLPIRTPQVVSRPLSDNLRNTILPGGQIMSDTRHPVVGVRMHPDGRIHLGGKIGNSRPEDVSHYGVLQAEVDLLFPDAGPLEWEYNWTGWVAMTPDLYPRLYDLAPGLVSVVGYSGRGIAMATLMGRELADWASGARTIDTLILPVSRLKTIPYYDLRGILVEGNMLYHRTRDRIGHALANK